ncbi:Uncharacterized membrane protein YoaK, UPF0700 family [Devosia lucknowensis]|uniref:Uncharacterized membrane protein YoaK, UPF0700 family n=1 Tax=Devosia lucknowensis TaxID=1096929 RepID=A0A1Y6EUS3_9HYPH|nr:DUF1275 family protein [Devosia lucknowensis]SMQ64991.1 Uncharacterized membrane protein YoaK, UPF0700 family [Devosia lucknowensis]
MTPTRHLLFGMLLTAAAGFLDSIGFIELGGYYVSFMSGNTTQGGTALVEGHVSVVLLSLALVALFFVGALVANLLALVDLRWGQVYASAAVMLGVATTLVLTLAGLPPSQTMLVLAATAGAQNAVLAAKGSVRLGATFVTGTLYTAAQDLAFALRGRAPFGRWLQHMLIWLSLLAGAAFGALAYGTLDIFALVMPLVVYGAFTIGHVVAAPRP